MPRVSFGSRDHPGAASTDATGDLQASALSLGFVTIAMARAVAAEHSFNVAERFSRGRIAGASVLCRQFIRE